MHVNSMKASDSMVAGRIRKALELFFVLLMSFPIGGFLYGFQEFRSPVSCGCVASSATKRRLRLYYFIQFRKSNRINLVWPSKWADYLCYVESNSKLCEKRQCWIVENRPKNQESACKRPVDYDEDDVLSDAA